MFVRQLATLGPVGFAPIAPATAASAVVTVIAWFLPVLPLPTVLLLLAVFTGFAVWASGVAEQTLGHDAGPIVIDEAVGQWVALLFVPKNVIAYIGAFLLFRLFDIWKPLGAREAQRLPGGWGVVADDVVAGVIACVTFQLVATLVRAAFPQLLLPGVGPNDPV